MDASKKSINDIFNGNRVLEIPFFQRSYVWTENQWERMLQDMELITILNKPYFLGSVILKQQLTSTKNGIGDVRTIIDGQQRLTTLNIFFKVLCLKTSTNSSFDRNFKLESNDLVLWHNHNDIESFEKILNLNSLEEISDSDNISQAYIYFKDNIDISKLDKQTILNNIMFVGIDLGHEDDEQQIFDTINSLGVRLTTAELLKNYFFNRDELDDYIKYWKDVFETNEDIKDYWDTEIVTGRYRRSLVDLFFYSYLQIKIQDDTLNISAGEKIGFSKVDSLFESYKKLIKNHNLNKKEILIELKEYAKLFYDNFDHEIINNELPKDFGIERLNAIIFGLETSTLIPYLLYVLKNNTNETEKKELYKALECYIMRRIIVKATSKNYNQLFTDSLISNKVLTKDSFLDYIKKKDKNINFYPSETELKNGLDNSVLINKQAAGILYFLETSIRDRSRHSTQLLGMQKYSLEHLMPKKWRNNWPNNLNVIEQENRDFRLKTMGNLAIITQTLNTSIRDSDWDTKKTGKPGKEGLIHYSSGIDTLLPYLNKDEWNEKEIEKRANNLYQEAIKIWDITA